MKIAQSLLSIFLGGVIAWVILLAAPPKKSTFVMKPWPLDEPDNENLALIGVGLVSRQSTPSVMDATAPPNDVVIMEQSKPVAIEQGSRETQAEVTHFPSSAPVPTMQPSPAPVPTMQSSSAPVPTMQPSPSPSPMVGLSPAPVPTPSPSPSA